MRRVRFPPKIVTIYSRGKKGFDCKNNYKRCKRPHLQLDNISKINYRMLVILLYTSFGLGMRNV